MDTDGALTWAYTRPGEHHDLGRMTVDGRPFLPHPSYGPDDEVGETLASDWARKFGLRFVVVR